MPASCRNLKALMCDPKSGATAAECQAWSKNVADWNAKLPANVTAETCQAAFAQNQSGLALRRASGGPPPAPTP